MLNKDKRSLLFCLVLGDGSLYKKTERYIYHYGVFEVGHCLEQADYLAWKAKLTAEITGREIKIGIRPDGFNRISLKSKKFRVWHKFTYPGNKKSRKRILHFIKHPELAMSIWLADDASTRCNQQETSSYIKLWACDPREEEILAVQQWFKSQFDVNAKLYWQTKKDGRKNPFFSFSVKDSMKLWVISREFLLQFKSMKHKFRTIEKCFQWKLHSAEAALPQDIVHATGNGG